MTTARRYIVLIQPADGLAADEPYPAGQQPRLHTVVLAVDHDAIVAERDRLRAALAVVEAAQLRNEVPASVIRDVRTALREKGRT